MIEKINKKAALQMTDKVFKETMVNKVNQVITALNVGVVHGNKVEGEREILQTQAVIVDNEFKRTMEELENV